jgi:gas vesicle protein
MNAGKVFLGVLVGVAVGATLGILFAPGKGTAVRRKISHKKDTIADALEEKFNEFIDGVTGKFETVKEEATRMAVNGKQKAEDFVEDNK